jgi:hypothetical protein
VRGSPPQRGMKSKGADVPVEEAFRPEGVRVFPQFRVVVLPVQVQRRHRALRDRMLSRRIDCCCYAGFRSSISPQHVNNRHVTIDGSQQQNPRSTIVFNVSR